MRTNEWQDSAKAAAETVLRAVAAEDPSQAVAFLSDASRAISEALREAMAAAVLDGASMRRVAEIAGIAPNSVPPRLARSKPLAPYVDDGTITADSIMMARYDAATGRPPMKFMPRRKDAS